jgi:Fic family protein
MRRITAIISVYDAENGDMYIHERPEWPKLRWSKAELAELLAEVRYMQGKLLGHMNQLGFNLQLEASLEILTTDIIKTSEIEGETLDVSQVRSSVAKRLGIDQGGSPYVSRDVDGIVEMTLEAISGYKKPLTHNRLFAWHASIFPGGRSGINRINVGQYRDKSSGVMQVVSGPFGREAIHFEAPSYDRLDREMQQFIDWYNADNEDLVIKAAIAHFWFVTIHPFDDGNGRISRVISDMTLARSDNLQQRFYSMSSQIQKERKSYYQILETCQKADVDITPWVKWFLQLLKEAIENSNVLLASILAKADFWKKHANELLNERQILLINKLLDGFEGKLTSSKWANIGKCSQDTALRDINDLIKRNIIRKEESGGRSTSYVLSAGQMQA